MRAACERLCMFLGRRGTDRLRANRLKAPRGVLETSVGCRSRSANAHCRSGCRRYPPRAVARRGYCPTTIASAMPKSMLSMLVFFQQASRESFLRRNRLAECTGVSTARWDYRLKSLPISRYRQNRRKTKPIRRQMPARQIRWQAHKPLAAPLADYLPIHFLNPTKLHRLRIC